MAGDVEYGLEMLCPTQTFCNIVWEHLQ